MYSHEHQECVTPALTPESFHHAKIHGPTAAGGCSEDCQYLRQAKAPTLLTVHGQVLIAPSRPNIRRIPRHRNLLISSLSSQQRGKLRRMAAHGSAWVLHGAILQAARGASRGFLRWFAKFVEWAWRSAQLWECFHQSKHVS